MKKLVDSYSKDGVHFKLLKENDEYIVERKEGKFVHNEHLGNLSADEAQFKFINFSN